MVKKLKFSKNVNNKKCAPKIVFFNDFFFFRKIQIFFDIEIDFESQNVAHFDDF